MAKRVKGGKKLNRFIRDAKRAKGVRGVAAGFYSTGRYPDGTPVTNVAAWNEFGFKSKYFPVETKDGGVRFIKRATPIDVPERPFFRQSIPNMHDPLLDVLYADVDPRTMVVDRSTAGKCGLVMQAEIRRSIVDLKEPENRPATIAIKGSSNPLVDTGFLKQQVTWRVQT